MVGIADPGCLYGGQAVRTAESIRRGQPMEARRGAATRRTPLLAVCRRSQVVSRGTRRIIPASLFALNWLRVLRIGLTS